MIIYDTRKELPTLQQVSEALRIYKSTPLTIDVDIWRELQTVKNHCANRSTLQVIITDTPPKGKYCCCLTYEDGYRIADGVFYGESIITVCGQIAHCQLCGQSAGSAGSYMHNIRKGANCGKQNDINQTSLW